MPVSHVRRLNQYLSFGKTGSNKESHEIRTRVRRLERRRHRRDRFPVRPDRLFSRDSCPDSRIRSRGASIGPSFTASCAKTWPIGLSGLISCRGPAQSPNRAVNRAIPSPLSRTSPWGLRSLRRSVVMQLCRVMVSFAINDQASIDTSTTGDSALAPEGVDQMSESYCGGRADASVRAPTGVSNRVCHP
jgi:hypothetical protein